MYSWTISLRQCDVIRSTSSHQIHRINISNEAKQAARSHHHEARAKYRKDIAPFPSRIVSFRDPRRSIEGLRREFFAPLPPLAPTTRPAHFYPRNPDRDIPFQVTSTFYLLGLDRSAGSRTIRAPSLYCPCRSRDRVPD